MPSPRSVYRDDGSEEIIQNLKTSDLHLGEWKEVIKAYHKRTGAGWTTIYTQIRQRLDAFQGTEAELELDFSKALDEKDPIIKLTILAKKKMKNTNDLHDYFKSTKRHLRDQVVSLLQFMWQFRNSRRPSQVLQFSLVGNAKLNDVDLLLEAEMKCFTSRRFTRTFKIAKLALLRPGASTSKSSQVRNQGLVAEAYEWYEEEVSSDDNEMVKVKVLMALADDKSGTVGKESAKMCISEQILNQKRKIFGVDQLTEDPSTSRKKDLVFVKSLADNTKVSIHNVERPWLSETKGFNFPNHDTGRILPSELNVNITNSSVTVNVTDYDAVEESTSVCSTPLPPLEKLAGAEPVSGPKTIKSILKSCSTVKTNTLKGVIINEPTNSSAPVKGNKNVSVSKNGSAFAGKLKNVKTKDDIPLSVVLKELNDLKLQISKNESAYSRNNKHRHVPQNSLQTKYKT
ncbi:hypothetical protein Tco_0854946 [Tanacetum coccineum]